MLVDGLSLLHAFLLPNAMTTFPYFSYFTIGLHEAEWELHTSWIIDSSQEGQKVLYFIFCIGS